MQRIGLLNGNNITYDYDVSANVIALLNQFVISGFGVSGSGASAQILPGKALIECTRTNGQKIMAYFESDANVPVDMTGTKKVYIAVNQAKIDDGSANAEDGTGVASIQTGASYPASNYIPLYSITAGVVTNEMPKMTLKSFSVDGVIKQDKGSDIESASTVDLSSATGNTVHITGTTTITSFGSMPAGAIFNIIFDGSLTLTHNATSLMLPTGANIQTISGDSMVIVSEGSGNWKVVLYQRYNGSPLASITVGSTIGSGIAGEDLTSGFALCIPGNVPVGSFTNLEDISTTLSNKRKSIQIIGSGISSNTIGFYVKKTGTLATNFGVRIETDNNGVPSGTLADINASTNIGFGTITTSLSEINATFPGNFTLSDGVKYHIVVFNGTYGSETLSTSNYYSLGYITYLNKKIITNGLFAYGTTNNQDFTALLNNIDTGGSFKYGVEIIPTRNIAITSITKISSAVATTGYIAQGTGSPNILASASFVGDVATFSQPFVLLSGVAYNIVTDSPGTSNLRYSTVGYPIAKNGFNITRGCDGSYSTTRQYNLIKIETKEVQEDNVVSNKNIYLNSNFLNKNLIYNANASFLETLNFIGIGKNTVLSGGVINFDTDGINKQQTSMVSGVKQYLTNTPGVIGSTPGTNIVEVGLALNSTDLLLNAVPGIKTTTVITPTVGASPYTYQNTTGKTAIVSITGGTVSQVAISRDNTNYYQTSGATNTFVTLGVNDYVKITYTGAPTLKVFTI